MNINNDAFLAEVFAGRSGEIWVADVAGDPGGEEAKTQWAGRIYDPQVHLDDARNQYFAISELKAGTRQRLQKNFHALRVLPLDDIGTKVERGKVSLLQPSYRIETSPGNEQWGYALDQPLTDVAKSKRLLDATKESGATDKGGMSLLRAVRLPSGINGKRKYGPPPPAVVLREWAPERRYTPEELARAFGVDLEGRRGRPRDQLPPLAPDDDGVLQLLDKRGMVKVRAPNERGFVTIICPWAAEHSDGDDSAGYVPGGVFKCLHGHCADRQIADVIAWLRAQGADVDAAVAAMPGPRGELLRLLGRYGFALSVDAFVDREQGTYHKPEALDRYLADAMRGYKPTKFLLERSDLLRVRTTIYLPGRPDVLELNETGHPILAMNTWRAGPVTPAAVGDESAIRPWLDHLAWLYPVEQERGIVLDFLTHVVQRRGKKINWMLIALAQMQGTGRDTLIQPVRSILGIRNVRTISTEELFSAFNDYELSELVCFSEADATDHNRWSVYRALKAKITTPPDSVSVNRKFIPATEQIKVANWLMLTNDVGAIATDRGDRRMCVAETPHMLDAVLAYTNTGVFKRLHALYADPQWLGMFHRYLLDRRIGVDFDAVGRAPETAAARRMFDEARTGLQVYIEETLGEWQCDLVRFMDLLALVQTQPGLATTTTNALAAALRRAGADKLPEFTGPGHKNVKGVWALRNVNRYMAMTPPQLREAWAKEQGNAPF